MKKCTICGQMLPLQAFYKITASPGYYPSCKICSRIRQKANAHKRDKNRWRKSFYPRTYGITEDDYNRMLLDQKGACFICGYIPKPGRRRLSVDHDHKTKEVRGLLCWRCNRALGLLKDNYQLFARAAYYLLRTQKKT